MVVVVVVVLLLVLVVLLLLFVVVVVVLLLVLLVVVMVVVGILLLLPKEFPWKQGESASSSRVSVAFTVCTLYNAQQQIKPFYYEENNSQSNQMLFHSNMAAL